MDTILSHQIAAVNVQPGQFIHHRRTRVTAGVYEVVSVKALCCGATSLSIRVMSRNGVEFAAGVIYNAGELVEVME